MLLIIRFKKKKLNNQNGYTKQIAAFCSGTEETCQYVSCLAVHRCAGAVFVNRFSHKTVVCQNKSIYRTSIQSGQVRFCRLKMKNVEMQTKMKLPKVVIVIVFMM